MFMQILDKIISRVEYTLCEHIASQKSVVKRTYRPEMTIAFDWDVKQQQKKKQKSKTWLQGYKLFLMLKSTKHEIHPAHKC